MEKLRSGQAAPVGTRHEETQCWLPRRFDLALDCPLFLPSPRATGDYLPACRQGFLLVGAAVCQHTPDTHHNHTGGGKHHHKGHHGDVLSRLLAQYDRTIVPTAAAGNGGLPQTIVANMLLRDISLNDAKMELSASITFRLQWTDPRLAYQGSSKHPYLPLRNGDKLWTPDIFFNDELNAHIHHILTPNVMYRIYPDGGVLMSTRLSLVLRCAMDFTWFPFDRQTCRIKFASYAHPTSEVLLTWRSDEPVETANLTTSQYSVESFKNGNITQVVTTGEYMTLTVDLLLKRHIRSYLSSYFIPTVVLVAITWLAFWMQPDTIAPRVILTVAALLAVYHLQTGNKLESNASPFGTAFAVWGQMCSAFIVLALIETVLVNYWTRRDMDFYQAGRSIEDSCLTSASVTPLLATGKYRLAMSSMPVTRGDRTDAVCRLAFPLVFILFSVAYWAFCL